MDQLFVDPAALFLVGLLLFALVLDRILWMLSGKVGRVCKTCGWRRRKCPECGERM